MLIIKNNEIYGSTKEIRRIARRLSDKDRLLDTLKEYPKDTPAILWRMYPGHYVFVDADIVMEFFNIFPSPSPYEKGKKLFPRDIDKAWKYKVWKNAVMKNNRI